ncbi:MAG: hypothetical protein LUE27_06500 [Clostridia bacterium]|nr:hypothetical protein [Clostridia bacterium]
MDYVVYEASREAKKLSVKEIAKIREYIYKCSEGDDKWAGYWFVKCMTTRKAVWQVQELARTGEVIDKNLLRLKILFSDYWTSRNAEEEERQRYKIDYQGYLDKTDELIAERDSMPDNRKNMDRKFQIENELMELHDKYMDEIGKCFSYNDDIDLWSACQNRMISIEHYYHPDIWK